MYAQNVIYILTYVFKLSQSSLSCVMSAWQLLPEFRHPHCPAFPHHVVVLQKWNETTHPIWLGIHCHAWSGDQWQSNRLVDSYAHNWWNDCTRTKCPPYSAMFTTGTVDVCLAHHQKQLGTADLSMPPQYSEILPLLRILIPTATSADQRHSGTGTHPGEEHGICYGVKRGSVSRSGTSPNPQTPTPNLTPIKNTNHMF